MTALSRRELMAAGGLVVFFSLVAKAAPDEQSQTRGKGGKGPPTVAPQLPGDLSKFPMLDSWIRIGADGKATVFTGKAELGQGIKTALLQLAADELDLPLAALTLVTADTERTVNEGITAGSHSMQDSGAAIANAAANVRLLLVEAAAARWQLPTARLGTAAGTVKAPDGRSLGYGALAADLSLQVAARPGVARREISQRRLIGHDQPRVDIPAKLTGGRAYVHDLTLPGMLHARVVRGPSHGTRWTNLDLDALARLPGVARLVRRGRFAAIIGEREWPLMQALRVAGQAQWEETHPPRPAGDLVDALKQAPAQVSPILDRRSPLALPAVRTAAARYTRPYLMHGSIGPSCAVALFDGDQMTVWTHSQGVYPLRGAIAGLLKMPPEKVRCIHVEGSGCYGHNGADDVAADAALAAFLTPGRPIRMLWTREQEHGWEPLGSAMVVELRGALDASGAIVDWSHDVWSTPHNARPTAPGDLIAGTEMDPPLPPTPPKPIPQPEGGGDRNAIPLYRLPSARVVNHFIPGAMLRVSALRSLGAHMNIFAIESFMDELASAAGRDPVAFRLAHLDDPRAREVIRFAAERFGWTAYRNRRGRAAGFAFARYKNLGAYCAVAMDVEVDQDAGRTIVHRVVAAVDSGDAVNPNGIRNQIEGAIVQSLSWTSGEAVGFDAQHRTSFDWSTYPILRFDDVPRAVEVHIVNRPDQPFLGTGEAGQGPAGAALANAIAAAIGQRRRDMPIGRG
jgi:CO/xanthine dehydrogenase Mo-binding subunit